MVSIFKNDTQKNATMASRGRLLTGSKHVRYSASAPSVSFWKMISKQQALAGSNDTRVRLK